MSDSLIPGAERAKRSILLVSALGSFLAPFMSSAINVALPRIGLEFSADTVDLAWVATAYLLSAAVLLVPCGRLSDILGRKRIFAGGILIFIATCSVLHLIHSLGWLIALRILQGVGGAMILSTSVAMLTSAYPAGERGKAIGLNTAAVYLGLTIGPFLGGFLVQSFGWRSIFLINIPLGAAIILLILGRIKGDWVEARGERYDFVGALVYVLALLGLLSGFSFLPAARGFWSLLLGGTGLAAFWFIEGRAERPLVAIQALRGNRVFVFSSLATLVNYSAAYGVSFILSIYLQCVKGFDARGAGLILMVQPVVQVLFAPVAGRISDRIEPGLVASLGMLLTTLGLFALVPLAVGTPLSYIMAALFLLGLGMAVFSSPNANVVMGSIGKVHYGVASGTLATMRLTGQMLSVGLSALVVSSRVGRVQITPQIAPVFVRSAGTTFFILAVLCGGGILASLARGRVRPGREGTVGSSS